MKKIFKTTMALALALALVLSCNVAAFAAELPATETTDVVEVTPVAASEDYSVSPCSNSYEYAFVVRTSWTTIAQITSLK